MGKFLFEVRSVRTTLTLVLMGLSLVVGIRMGQIPLPASDTAFSLTLNNGIHFVTTPEIKLGKECKIEQEFELCVFPS
jgi:hypothetical protein